jgi:hypothetical protein
MRTFYFRVADHIFAIETAHDLLVCCPNYAPFLSSQQSASCIQPVLTLRVSESELPSLEGWTLLYIDRSDDDMPRIEMYRRGEEWQFRFSQSRDGAVVGAFTCDARMKNAVLYGEPTRFAIDNTMMLLYAFSTADCRTLLFHASVIVRGENGYMFLGKSGTGKSTHAEQWMKAFSDAERLNDDNPVVRVSEDGLVRVYGSPWSGKTPCYKAADAQVKALVQLAQAPENEIKLLRPTQAYPYILSSVSGLKILPQMMDRLYETIAALLESTPVYFLDCLPNTDAAEVCYSHLPH